MQALVIGASGGIGAAMVAELKGQGWQVTGLSRSGDGLDVTDEASVSDVLSNLNGPFDLVFVATGALVSTAKRPEKALREVTSGELTAQLAINAVGPMMVLKHVLPHLPRQRRAVFAALSARVGSIGDNHLGGWHSYRASKAALNQLMRGAAVELARSHPQAIVAALHPGTVATPFTDAFAQSHDRVAPNIAAQNLITVIDGLTPDSSGGFFDYAGRPIPW